MTDRERLIELLEDTLHEWESDVSVQTLTEIAEHLIENGVIVPPCKVGDKLYMLNRDKSKVQEMIFESPDIRCHCILDDEFDCCLPVCQFFEHGICAHRFKNDFSEIGKTVFLTREEAEQALKERD